MSRDEFPTYPNGNVYVGAVKNRRPHGQGTIIYPTGAKYTGEWKQGKKHGQGVQRDKHGRITKMGRWEDNGYVGK
jgi:hypothetical protein